jgi:hypothetical protein
MPSFPGAGMWDSLMVCQQPVSNRSHDASLRVTRHGKSTTLTCGLAVGRKVL